MPTLLASFDSLANLGAFALVAWLLRRVFTHTIPRLAEDFKDTLKDSQSTFKEELRHQRSDFKEELRLERIERADIGKRMDRVVDLVERLREDQFRKKEE